MDLIRTEQEWADRAKRLLKAELKRAGVTYEELAERLGKHGMSETKASVANKLARGAFTATFLLASLAEIGVDVIRVSEI